MQDTQNTTTVLCLFHTHEHAQEALADLQKFEVPADAVTVIGDNANSQGLTSTLRQYNLPENDVRLLSDGLASGGTIIAVSGPEAYTDKAEDIFGRHHAAKVDEKVISDDTTGQVLAGAPATGKQSFRLLKKNFLSESARCGGAASEFTHIVETPVEETIVLEQERAIVERHPVNRPVTEADLEKMRIQSIEVTESEEVPVIEKSAHVVEEVLVSKEAIERTEHVSDTVRRTQVEVEQLGGETASSRKGRKNS